MMKTNPEEEENKNYDDLEVGSAKAADSSGDENTAVISRVKLAQMRQLAESVRDQSTKLIEMLGVFAPSDEVSRIGIGQLADDSFQPDDSEDGRVIEGVFDGENMIGPDGKQYSVPANYASKSKLVEGDMMKLTITQNGTFVYKQIGPIDRSRLVGSLEQSGGGWQVSVESRKWRVLTASVTYYKGQPGDEVILLVPKSGESKWGAVENIVRQR